MKSIKTWKHICTKIFAVVVLVLAISGVTYIVAMPDESNAVHINESQIENSTLIIGSHLIYLTSMNDSIYEIASKSAQNFNQHNMYYKSEMAGGTWYEISDASALADITTVGKVVDRREIEELWLTHHTKSDGITYDLLTGESLSVFDIENPYDLEKMSELEPIKTQYDLLQQLEDKSETNIRDIQYIEEVYNKDRETDTTKELDKNLKDLQQYYEHLANSGAEADKKDIVMNIMKQIDATRRNEVLTVLNDTELQKMSEVISREFVYVQGEITGELVTPDDDLSGREKLDGFIQNVNLVNAIGDAMVNVQETYATNSVNMLEEGTNVLSKTEYRLTEELISGAENKDYSQCDKLVNQLICLKQINDGVTSNEALEKEFITTELLEAAEQAYKDSISAGEGDEYKMLSSMASAATKANVLKKQLNETEIVRNELQFIQQALVDRMSQEEASEFMEQQLNKLESLKDTIKDDAFAPYASSSLDQYADWANKVLNNIQNAIGNNEMSNLVNQKDALQTELMSALDKNQLDKAKKIEAEIEAVDKAIEDLEKELNQILNSDQASESEKALAASKLSAGSSLKALQDMKNNILEEIRDGNLEGIENVIDGIGALAKAQPEGALAALKDIYQELVNQELMSGGSSALKDLMGKVEDVTKEQMNNFIGNLSENDFSNLIKSFVEEKRDDGSALPSGSLGNVMNELTDAETVVILAGLNKYAQQTGSSNAKDIIKTYANVAQNNENSYVFDLYDGDMTYEYIPTDKMAEIMGFRYIFDNSQKSVTLQKRSQYYKFAAFSNIMQKGNTEIEMTRTTGFEGVIYIPKDVAEEQFALTAQMLEDISYGLILTEEMQKQADEFTDYLLEVGGSF